MHFARRSSFAAAVATAGLVGTLAFSPSSENARPGRSAVTGVVYDSLHMGPLAGARVQLQKANIGATTDSLGRFRMEQVPAGDDVAWVDHPVLDSLGLSSLASPVHVGATGDVTMQLSVPSFSTIWRHMCENPLPGESANFGVIHGSVVTLLGLPLDSTVVVEASWTDGAGKQFMGRLPLDDRGTFAACGVPTTSAVWVRAAGPQGETPPVVVHLNGERVIRRTLTLAAAVELQLTANPKELPLTQVAANVANGGTVIGFVGDTAGAGVSGARVRLMGVLGEWRSAADGRFVVTRLPPGTYRLQVTALPFGTREAVLDLAPGDTAHVALSMVKVTTLGVVTVREKSPAQRVEYLEERRKKGGYFVDSTKIAQAVTVASVIQVPGITVREISGGILVASTMRPSMSGKTSLCRTEIYLDGLAMNPERPGAQPTMSVADIKDEIAVIESYSRSGLAPHDLVAGAGLMSRGDCGMILIWTKGFLGKR